MGPIAWGHDHDIPYILVGGCLMTNHREARVITVLHVNEVEMVDTLLTDKLCKEEFTFHGTAEYSLSFGVRLWA